LYKSHQGAHSLRTTIESESKKFLARDQAHSMPVLAGSASLKEGQLTLSITNVHATLPVNATIEVRGAAIREASMTMLHHDHLAAHNTFDEPDTLRPMATALDIDPAEWRLTLPPASVNVIRMARS
jgi:alpha-N-arabinofuranosidase